MPCVVFLLPLIPDEYVISPGFGVIEGEKNNNSPINSDRISLKPARKNYPKCLLRNSVRKPFSEYVRSGD